MNPILKYSGVVALVILAILAISSFFGHGSGKLFGSTSCASITCLSGGLRLVSDAGGDFESDVAAVFTSTVSAAAAAFSGAVSASSTVQVTGATTLYSSLTQTTTNAATSTAKLGCIQLVATSTATPIYIAFTASSVATTTFGSQAKGGTVVWSYGTCPQ